MAGLNVQPKLSRRGRYLIAEIAPAKGPVSLDIGTGSFQDLFGYNWVAVIDKQGSLNIFQEDPGGTGWNLIVGLTDTPIAPSKMRHLSLAFDQAGKPIIAFEHEGQKKIYVRQWDPISNSFTYRGPFDGVDPVLWIDALASHDVESSDIYLIYLSPDRRTLKYRIQVETYVTVREIFTFTEQLFLDQAVTTGLQLQIVLSDKNNEPYAIFSGPYPYKTSDNFTSSTTTLDSQYTMVNIRVNAETENYTTALDVLDGSYKPSVIKPNPITDTYQADYTVLDNSYVLAVLRETIPTDTYTSTTTVNDNQYVLAVIRYTQGAEPYSVSLSVNDGYYYL